MGRIAVLKEERENTIMPCTSSYPSQLPSLRAGARLSVPIFQNPGQKRYPSPKSRGERTTGVWEEGARPGRPRKGRPVQRYRPTAKLARSRLAVELRHSMLPVLRDAGPWAR